MYEHISELTSPEQATSARARVFAKHCFALADNEGRVRASRFELSRIPALAPYTVVLGVQDHGNDFLVRHAGTRLISDFLGADPTGRLLSEALRDDEFGRRTWYIARQVTHLGKPLLNQPGRTWFRDKEYLTLETVTFALVDDTANVTKITAIFDFAPDIARDS